MNKLLLLSKAVALQEGAQVVTIEHFGIAIAYYGKITSERARELLRPHFGNVTALQTPSVIDPNDVILRAQLAPQIKVTPTLTALFRKLGATGEEYFALHNPTGKSDDLTHINHIEKLLKANLLGQEHAVDSLITAMCSRALLKRNRRSVAGAYVFAGATACGKSLAARLIAEGLGNYPITELDCSSYDNGNERFVFDGSPSAYANARPGVLTSFVRENPHCVVVLDHFSRMHTALQTVLLSVLETGVLRDNFGFYRNNDPKAEIIASPEVDFSGVFFILTTDIGGDLYNYPALIDRLRAAGAAQLEAALVVSLSSARNETSTTPSPAFDQAVLSRILSNGAAILFEKLTYEALRGICAHNLPRAGEMLLEGVGGGVMELGPNSESLIDLLVISHGGQAEARKLEVDALARGIYAPLVQRWRKGFVRQQVIIDLPETDAKKVAEIMASLGVDPIRTLSRQMKRVQFEVDVLEDDISTTLVCRSPRLVKIESPSDYQGGSKLLIEVPNFTLADIAGLEPIKAKLRQQIALLRNADELAKHGHRPPGGMLLYGPPGTGKTSIGRAVAGEAGLPFIAIVATDLLNPKFAQEVFKKARENGPCIVFFDEIDALGKRDHGHNPSINTTLAELDGFASHDSRVFVIGATNFPDRVDPALLRPGRMELHFEVPLPDRKARGILLRRTLSDASEMQLESLTDRSSGMSGAAILAASRDVVVYRSEGGRAVPHEAMAKAIDAQRFGAAQPMSESLKEQVAWHEAGHALALFKLCPGERVDCVRVGRNEKSAGLVMTTSNGAHAQPRTRERVKFELMALLAGRSAQVIRYGGEAGTDDGATNDLASAVALAASAVTEWGLDPVLGTEALAMMVGRTTAQPLPKEIVQRVDAWVREADADVREFLRIHWALLEAITLRLIAEDMLDHRQLAELLGADGENS